MGSLNVTSKLDPCHDCPPAFNLLHSYFYVGKLNVTSKLDPPYDCTHALNLLHSCFYVGNLNVTSKLDPPNFCTHALNLLHSCFYVGSLNVTSLLSVTPSTLYPCPPPYCFYVGSLNALSKLDPPHNCTLALNFLHSCFYVDNAVCFMDSTVPSEIDYSSIYGIPSVSSLAGNVTYSDQGAVDEHPHNEVIINSSRVRTQSLQGQPQSSRN